MISHHNLPSSPWWCFVQTSYSVEDLPNKLLRWRPTKQATPLKTLKLYQTSYWWWFLNLYPCRLTKHNCFSIKPWLIAFLHPRHCMIRSFAGIDTERPLIVNLLFCDKSQYTVLNVIMTLTYTLMTWFLVIVTYSGKRENRTLCKIGHLAYIYFF